MPKFYITTSIPYVNAKPHIGHALEFVQADVIARHRKMRGEQVKMTTGGDENSLKIVLAAEKLGKSAAELCEENSGRFKELAEMIELDYDAFVRTSIDPGHKKVAQALWKACDGAGDIYKKKYGGLYCVGCELFYTENELDGGLCPEHKTKPEFVEEENYFFRLSKYQGRLLELIESDQVKIIPDFRKTEMLNFIKSGLSDFSISRSISRSHGWGLKVPGDESQIIYVWFDALGTYLTGVGFASDQKEFDKYWPADMHVVGKGILRFHAIYWIAMLMSAKIKLPKSILVHGYVTVDGQKMSKSIGNVVDPIELVKKYGAEPIRYYLMKEISTFQDGDFSETKLRDVINNELVGNLGNFVNRTFVFINSKLDGRLAETGLGEGALLMKEIHDLVDLADKLLEEGQLNFAILKILEISSMGNRYFQENEPWKLVKEGDNEAAREVLFVCANIARILGIMLYPFMPCASEELLAQIGEKPGPIGDAKKIAASFEISKPRLLFSKVE